MQDLPARVVPGLRGSGQISEDGVERRREIVPEIRHRFETDGEPDEPVDDPVVVLEGAREVSQFLKDADIPLRRFVRELNGVHQRARRRRPAPKRG